MTVINVLGPEKFHIKVPQKRVPRHGTIAIAARWGTV
jgi:hypothetical protein